MALDTFSSDMTRARLRHAIGVLGGVSKKQAKRFEKARRELSLEIAASFPVVVRELLSRVSAEDVGGGEIALLA